MDVTPRVRVGDVLTLVGREVQGMVATVPLHGHAGLVFSTDLTPARAAALGALVGAPVHVVLPALPADPPPATDDAAPADGADGADDASDGAGDSDATGDADGRVPHLAFAGVVRRVQIVARPQGGDRLVVEAAGASYALGEHHTQQRFAAHTALDLARGFAVRVDPSAQEAAAAPLHLVQAGESDWAFLARVAADAGLVLRPAWPRTADGTATDPPPPTPAADAALELARGFRTTDDARHLLTYGRELLAAAGGVAAVNAGVDGAHYDVDGSHAHAFADVRQTPTWTQGGRALVQAAVDRSSTDANGGSPGLVPAAVRAPTPALFRTSLRRASERRLGGAVRVTGRTTYAALRAGDRVTLQAGNGPAWALADALAGEYGVLAVVHRWDGQLYENGFVATPWAAWHPEPTTAESAGPLLAAAWSALTASDADGHAVSGGSFGGGSPFGGRSAGGNGAFATQSAHSANGSGLADLGALGAGGGVAGLGLAGDGVGGHGATTARAALGVTGASGGAQPLTFGIVVDDADPLSQGRVRVRYAWQAPDAPPSACAWARVASVVAGHERGIGALPTPGDEVLVAFADGHAERPVVVGALWSGKDVAAHRPGLQHWVTRAGSTVRLLEGEVAGGPGRERVELYTPEGKTWVQLAAAGPGGVPLVTVRSAGDLHLEAPNGTVRVHAKHVEHHVTGDHRTEVGGAHTVHAGGAVTLESGAALGLAARAGLAAKAGGTLALHGGSGHEVTGARVEHHPSGGSAPGVQAPRVAPKATAWAKTAVPAATRLTHTADAARPRIKAKAAAPTAPQRVTRQAAAAPTAAGALPPFKPLPSGGCAAAWNGVMTQTRSVLNSGGGATTPAQKLTRNRAISAAYARLSQGDPRMVWAGLASVVSTQAHCAMQNADTAVTRLDAEKRAAPVQALEAGLTPEPLGGPDKAAVILTGATLADGMGHEVQDALYDTNREIFTDIYPDVAMYKTYGMAGVGNGLGQCGGARPDGRQVAPQIRTALAQINAGQIGAGSRDIADYEQTVIVQQRIYDDPNRPLLKAAMWLNSKVANSPAAAIAKNLLRVQKPEVAIAANCGQGTPVPFGGDITVAADRVNYYKKLVVAYQAQGSAAQNAMSGVIQRRDPLSGGPDYGP